MFVLPAVPLHAMGYFLEVRDVVIPSLVCGSNLFYPLPFFARGIAGVPFAPCLCPMARASGPRKRSSATAAASGGAEAARPTGVLEQAEGGKRARTQLKRRSSSEQVSRAIDQHFPEASLQQIESTKVEGQTLREVLKHDIKAKGAGRLGATYWQQVAQKFKFGDFVSQLQVKDKQDAVGSDLLHAIGLASDTNSSTRSAEQLRALLQHRADINQREFVGLMIASSKFHSGGLARATVDNIYIDVLKCVARPLGQNPSTKRLRPLRSSTLKEYPYRVRPLKSSTLREFDPCRARPPEDPDP